MDGLTADGFVVLGGPISDTEALLLIEAVSADEVVSRFARDPWIIAGVLKLESIRPWQLWLDSRQPPKT